MTLPRSTLVPLAIVAFAIGVACRPTRGTVRGSDASTCTQPAGDEGGVASDHTWRSLAGTCARIQVPSGWSWSRDGEALVSLARTGQSRDARPQAGFVVAGARTKEDVQRVLARALEQLELQIGPPHSQGVETTLNGLRVSRQEFGSARASGVSARAVALVADAPEGNGFVVLLGFAAEGHEHELVAAVESLSRG